VRRRSLAVFELLVAGFLWFLAYDSLKGPYNPHMDLRELVPFLILFGFAAAAAAVTAWLGIRRWKVWQAAALAVPVVTIIVAIIRVNLF
jgi:hypothetical protein